MSNLNTLELQKKKDRYQQEKQIIPELTLQSFEQAFEVEYTHNSTAIEGNTLTLMETKLVLEDRISVGGKSLQEIYESVNHQKAYHYVKDCITKGLPLDETIIKEIHAKLMENIIIGGIYRNEMYKQVKNFYSDLQWKANEINEIELAAWTHAEFVRIHPFPDGNGRTSRLIMNYQLMAHGFPAISIAKEKRLEYFKALEVYSVSGDIAPFAEMVAEITNTQLDRYLGMIDNAKRNTTTDINDGC